MGYISVKGGKSRLNHVQIEFRLIEESFLFLNVFRRRDLGELFLQRVDVFLEFGLKDYQGLGLVPELRNRVLNEQLYVVRDAFIKAQLRDIADGRLSPFDIGG